MKIVAICWLLTGDPDVILEIYFFEKKIYFIQKKTNLQKSDIYALEKKIIYTYSM